MNTAHEELSLASRLILRDHNAKILGAWTNHYQSPNAFCVKMAVVIQAFTKAEELRLENVVFESDSLQVILALLGLREYEDLRAQKNLTTGKHFLVNHPLWIVKHISRSCNLYAHHLAKWAKQSNFMGSVNLDNLPLSIFL